MQDICNAPKPILVNRAQLSRRADVSRQTVESRIASGVLIPVAHDLHQRPLFELLAIEQLRESLHQPIRFEA